MLFVACCSLFVVLVFGVCCLLAAVRWLLFVCSSLCVVGCAVFAVCCLLFAV